MIRGRYGEVTAAVLNLSGWYDDAYGVEGATTNFHGLLLARSAKPPRTHLVLGPWVHGAPSPGKTRAGDLDFGAAAGFLMVPPQDAPILTDPAAEGAARGGARRARPAPRGSAKPGR